jgi:hypothetical protein
VVENWFQPVRIGPGEVLRQTLEERQEGGGLRVGAMLPG